jgi:hypothetical protein
MSNKHYAGKSSHKFSEVTSANIPRSTFFRNNTLLTTFDAGKLVPIYIDEVLPGDTYDFDLSHVSRLVTPLVPTMDSIDLEFFAFFVPNRLVWTNWPELMGENRDSAWTPASAAASVPTYTAGSSYTQTEGKIGDYYGIPAGMDFNHHGVNYLPLRGYGLIWNEWFRNQNVQAPLTIQKGDSVTVVDSTYGVRADLLNVNKPFDYFTACLPEPQKGDSSLIPIDIGSMIPVLTQATAHTTALTNQPLKLANSSGGAIVADTNLVVDSSSQLNRDNSSVGTTTGILQPTNLWADPTGLGDIGSSTISELRTAFQIQRLYERDARGGTRYVEMLKAHFGVNSGDYRLQRPEYLGHQRHTMGVYQVPQTSATGLTGGSTELGGLAAYAHSQGQGKLFTKSFVEHGFLHIFAVARHKKTYSEGLDRFWSRQDRFDYYHPVLAHISEQPVYTKEIYSLSNNPTTVFGYQEAWSDYRYKPSRATSLMSPNSANTLSIWHYGENYSSAPTLSDSWMQDNSATNLERTLADQTTDADQFILNCLFKNKATRPMPTNSIPGLIDHF